MKIKRLTQLEAEIFMKGLPPNVLNRLSGVLCEEIKLGISKVRALPENEKIYYLIHVNISPYLLAAITPNLPLQGIGISFVNIDPQMTGHARECVTELLDKELIRYCRDQGKKRILARIKHNKAESIFRAICKNPPKGINPVFMEKDHCVLEVI